MHPYDANLYYDDIVRKQGRVFFDIRDALPGVDEKWFINGYLRSNMRRLLDHANPKYAAMPTLELIDWFINKEAGGEYRRGETWGGFLPQWAGQMYAHYQWQYDIPSAELIDMLPLSEMQRIFPTLHQAGWEVAATKIHDEVLGLSTEE